MIAYSEQIQTVSQCNKLKVAYEFVVAALAITAVILTVMDTMEKLNDAILIIFTIDYLARLFTANEKLRFIKLNMLDLVAIIPFSSLFRVFRMARLFKVLKIVKIAKVTKLVRVLGFSKVFHRKTKKFLDTNGFKYIIYITVAIVIIGSFVIYVVEKGDIIKSYGDALWLSFTSVTLFGYEGVEQMSIAGKMICGFLALIGVLFTATFIKYLDTKKNNRDEQVTRSIDVSGFSDEDIKAIATYVEFIRQKARG